MRDRWIDLESSREDREYYRREADRGRNAFVLVWAIAILLVFLVWTQVG